MLLESSYRATWEQERHKIWLRWSKSRLPTHFLDSGFAGEKHKRSPLELQRAPHLTPVLTLMYNRCGPTSGFLCRLRTGHRTCVIGRIVSTTANRWNLMTSDDAFLNRSIFRDYFIPSLAGKGREVEELTASIIVFSASRTYVSSEIVPSNQKIQRASL